MKKIFFIMSIITVGLLITGCNNTNKEVKNEPVSSGNTEVTLAENIVNEPTSAESQLTEEMAYEAIYNYCSERYGYSLTSSSMYLEVEDETDDEYKIKFRSYTGAYVYFYIDKTSGVARMVEVEPNLDVEEETGTINVFDYLNK